MICPSVNKHNKIYPDFIAADQQESKDNYRIVYVLKTKAFYLKNEDAKYKQNKTVRKNYF